MAPARKRKKRGIGRKYKASTNGISITHGDGTVRSIIAGSNNPNGRGGGEYLMIL
jgi:hypothetical protein